MDLLPGEYIDLYGVDSTQDEGDGLDTLPLTPEFMNGETPNGCPPFKLSLKKNCIVMLLRNIDTLNGLCNGVRLEVLDVSFGMLRCRRITGISKGDEVFIPRFTFTAEDPYHGYRFQRRQFPVVPAYCMTFNKSQGQTLEKVGLVFRTPAFSHGTVYVGCSRVSDKDSIRITRNLGTFDLDENQKRIIVIDNVVFKPLLEEAAKQLGKQ